MTTDTDYTTERWRYAGQRILKGKLVHAWEDTTGAERLYGKGTVRAVGAAYDVQVLHADEDVITMLVDSPVFVDDVDDDKTPVWVGKHRAAQKRDRERLAENRAKRDDGFGRLTLDELREQIHRLPSNDAWALADVVRVYVMGGVK
jgi:hypothetical protein